MVMTAVFYLKKINKIALSAFIFVYLLLINIFKIDVYWVKYKQKVGKSRNYLIIFNNDVHILKNNTIINCADELYG